MGTVEASMRSPYWKRPDCPELRTHLKPAYAAMAIGIDTAGLLRDKPTSVLPLSCGAKRRPQRSVSAHCKGTAEREGILVLYQEGTPAIGRGGRARIAKFK